MKLTKMQKDIAGAKIYEIYNIKNNYNLTPQERVGLIGRRLT